MQKFTSKGGQAQGLLNTPWIAIVKYRPTTTQPTLRHSDSWSVRIQKLALIIIIVHQYEFLTYLLPSVPLNAFWKSFSIRVWRSRMREWLYFWTTLYVTVTEGGNCSCLVYAYYYFHRLLCDIIHWIHVEAWLHKHADVRRRNNRRQNDKQLDKMHSLLHASVTQPP